MKRIFNIRLLLIIVPMHTQRYDTLPASPQEEILLETSSERKEDLASNQATVPVEISIVGQDHIMCTGMQCECTLAPEPRSEDNDACRNCIDCIGSSIILGLPHTERAFTTLKFPINNLSCWVVRMSRKYKG